MALARQRTGKALQQVIETALKIIYSSISDIGKVTYCEKRIQRWSTVSHENHSVAHKGQRSLTSWT